MSARGIGWLLSAVAVAAGFCTAPSAEAAFGPIQLISKTPTEQAGVGSEPAISADGRYVAFCAELGGKEGIFREQLETGQVLPVAVSPIGFAPCKSESSRVQVASAPSISADGRYVSFDTTASLVEEDTDKAGDVYVADMDSSPPTYQLVSAVSGGEEPLPGGSLAANRSAISGDGTRVAFVNQGNVYVRDLATEETILISARRDRLTGAMESEVPVEGGGPTNPLVPRSAPTARPSPGSVNICRNRCCCWPTRKRRSRKSKQETGRILRPEQINTMSLSGEGFPATVSRYRSLGGSLAAAIRGRRDVRPRERSKKPPARDPTRMLHQTTGKNRFLGQTVTAGA